MKKINKFSSLVALLIASTLFCGCSDQFLQDKRNYGNFTEVIFDDYEGAKGRVDFLYNVLLPSSTSGISFDLPSAGVSDEHSKCTEEYGGFSDYVNPIVTMDNSTVPDYIYRENKNISPYGRIRECNLVIEGIEKGALPQEKKEELLGQVYFFRAWCYYRLVKIYGGVPIIDYVQNPMIGDGGGLDLVIPRSTTKKCIDFICEDLERAGTYLPVVWSAPNVNYGRVTAGTALALQGRARLLYASPLFNRADNKERWDLAYESNKAALAKLAEGGFGLAYMGEPGNNASGWAKMFADYQSPEAVFVTLYNTVKSSPGTSYNKNNGWENSIRPKNAGGGGKSTTAQMVDLFPMADGKKPGESKYPYDEKCFFLNRDPRFYRTFAFPGVKWAFNGDPTPLNSNPAIPAYPYQGSDYVLWNYAWYSDATEQKADNQTGYATDGLGTSNASIYIRKRTDDYDVNTSPLYNYDITVANRFGWSGAPYMELRYAEVLLNFAESACGAEHYDEAVDALQKIRQRVGYTLDNNYGLEANLENDRAKLFAAILYERQIELAYEGKRFDDMRRWMLWDGGAEQVSLKSSWKLLGFGGNTCTYLGVQPFNGKRRTGVEIQVAENLGQAAEENGKDPIIAKGIKRPAALNLMKDVVLGQAEGEENKPIDNLADFYRNNLARKTTRIDGDTKYSITFLPKYYFIGFRTNMQKMNVKLEQTVGWADFNKGNADGVYDPLAE